MEHQNLPQQNLLRISLDGKEFHIRQQSLLLGKLDTHIAQSLMCDSVVGNPRVFVVVHAKKILRSSTHEVLIVSFVICINDDLSPKKQSRMQKSVPSSASSSLFLSAAVNLILRSFASSFALL